MPEIKPAIQDKSRTSIPKALMPIFPSIAVHAKHVFGGGSHTSIFIACPEERPGGPDELMYYMTDLGAAHPDIPAWIKFVNATTWANPKSSKTWSINNARARNAVAVARQFAKRQEAWTKETQVRPTYSTQWKDGERSLVVRDDYTGMSRGPTPEEEHRVVRFNKRKSLSTQTGRVIAPITDLGYVKEKFPGPVARARMWEKQKGERIAPVTYKKSFSHTHVTAGPLRGSRYMTCASYAQAIMHAAGIAAPFYMGLQTGENLVAYNKNVFSWLATLATGPLPD